jgi:hypothetical protein
MCPTRVTSACAESGLANADALVATSWRRWLSQTSKAHCGGCSHCLDEHKPCDVATVLKSQAAPAVYPYLTLTVRLRAFLQSHSAVWDATRDLCKQESCTALGLPIIRQLCIHSRSTASTRSSCYGARWRLCRDNTSLALTRCAIET